MRDQITNEVKRHVGLVSYLFEILGVHYIIVRNFSPFCIVRIAKYFFLHQWFVIFKEMLGINELMLVTLTLNSFFNEKVIFNQVSFSHKNF